MRARSLWTDLLARRPRSAREWIALAVLPCALLLVLSPLVVHPWTLGQHNWDQMEMHRYVVRKTILQFHQFPFWNPYTCGGHPAWGGLESAPNVVSPWLPAYLALPLPIAMRVEIAGSMIWALVGAWLLATRFTTSPALRVLLPLVFVLNSRLALQLAAGHSWHLVYGCLPWMFYLFDRALRASSLNERDVCVVAAATILALMIYACGIYPVPHTLFALGIYAAVLAWTSGSLRPLGVLGSLAGIGAGLSSPKLVPTLEGLFRYPRLVATRETVNPDGFIDLLTWRVGDYRLEVHPTFEGMWHEWGLYLGWPVLVALVAGVVVSRGPRARAFKWAGLVMTSMVFGAFAWFAPWALLHHLPVFSSQHVPSRWLFPAVLPLACAATLGAERMLAGAGRWRPRIELALTLWAVCVAIDLGTVARRPIAQSFVDPMPALADATSPFHVEQHVTDSGGYRPGLFGVSTLPAVMQNVGTIDCNTVSPMHNVMRPPSGPVQGLGARGMGEPDYRGETYVAEGHGTATIVEWTPNEVEVAVEGAKTGDHVVLNQNWDPGWTVNGDPAQNVGDAVAVVLDSPRATLRFRYRPRTLPLGLVLFGVTVAGLAVALWARRRVPTEIRVGEPAPLA